MSANVQSISPKKRKEEKENKFMKYVFSFFKNGESSTLDVATVLDPPLITEMNYPNSNLRVKFRRLSQGLLRKVGRDTSEFDMERGTEEGVFFQTRR